MSIWEASRKAIFALIDSLQDVADKRASNAIVLRKSGIFVYFRANKDGSVDVTPTVRMKNISPEHAEKFLRALDDMGTAQKDRDETECERPHP